MDSGLSVWVIPAHVPLHWTTVTLDCTRKEIHFLDTLPSRSGGVEAAQKLRVQVLKLIDFISGVDSQEWRWMVKKVRHFHLKQHHHPNSYSASPSN